MTWVKPPLIGDLDTPSNKSVITLLHSYSTVFFYYTSGVIKKGVPSNKSVIKSWKRRIKNGPV